MRHTLSVHAVRPYVLNTDYLHTKEHGDTQWARNVERASKRSIVTTAREKKTNRLRSTRLLKSPAAVFRANVTRVPARRNRTCRQEKNRSTIHTYKIIHSSAFFLVFFFPNQIVCDINIVSSAEKVVAVAVRSLCACIYTGTVYGRFGRIFK